MVNEFVDGLVWAEFLDVFLDTFPLAGGYSCREVMAKGKPIVHMLSEDMPNLDEFLDPELGAQSVDDYVYRVSRLLQDRALYTRACERALQLAREQADLRPFAETFHIALQAAVERVAMDYADEAAKALTGDDAPAKFLA